MNVIEGIRSYGPNSEVMLYEANPDGTRGKRKRTCSVCGHTGTDVLSNLVKEQGSQGLVEQTVCADIDACNERVAPH